MCLGRMRLRGDDGLVLQPERRAVGASLLQQPHHVWHLRHGRAARVEEARRPRSPASAVAVAAGRETGEFSAASAVR